METKGIQRFSLLCWLCLLATVGWGKTKTFVFALPLILHESANEELENAVWYTPFTVRTAPTD